MRGESAGGVGAPWFDEGMDADADALREQSRALWATVACFVLGALAGAAVLWGNPRPFAGDGSVILPAALIAGVITGAAFVVSTLLHRAGETEGMPPWQALISNLSTVAVTIALGGVAGLGVLLAGEVLASGLRGLELSAIGGGALTGVASAIGGRLAFRMGVDLSTRSLAGLLFSFLVIGTLFAMITAGDPTWWERNFSQLGIGDGSWAFNGTLIVAGVLVATVGSYIGRDLHRMRGDSALRRIGAIVIVWALAGAALTAVGLFPVHTMRVPHLIAAFAALVLMLVAAVITARALPAAPRTLRVVTVGLVVLVAVAVVLTFGFRMLSVTVLEGIVIALVLLWLSTFVQFLAVLAPATPRVSARPTLLHP